MSVIEDLGKNISEFKKEKNPDPRNSYFKLDLNDFTLDVLPGIKADFKFSEVFKRMDTVELEGVPIHFMIYSDLIEDKLATAREKDLEDIKQLKKHRG